MDPDAPEPLAALRSVPPAVEAWWLAQARAATGAGDDEQALERLVPAVQALSDGFTVARPARLARYGDDPLARAAYALWFGTQAWVRTRLPLAMAHAQHGWRPRTGALRMLDIGAAGGAAGLSAATWLRTQGATQVELVALDHAAGALRDVEGLCRAALPAALAPRVATHACDARTPSRWPAATEGRYDLVLVSFTLNELFDADDEAGTHWLGQMVRRLEPGGLLLALEPAVKERALSLLERTATLVQQGHAHAWGPQHGPGPWRPAPDTRTWPHEVRRWTMPQSVERLNRTLWRSAGELAYAYVLLGSEPPPAPAADAPPWRLASALHKGHGKHAWLAYDRAGALVTLELQDRDATRAERERLGTLERGDLVVLEPAPRTMGSTLRLARARDLVRVTSPEGTRDPWQGAGAGEPIPAA